VHYAGSVSLAFKDTQLLLLQLYCIYGGTGSTRLLPALSLHAEIFRDAMRDVFGIFFVAFITGTPLLHAISPSFLLKAE
jgi:ABC-type arginine/histidine transport system permease subunit